MGGLVQAGLPIYAVPAPGSTTIPWLQACDCRRRPLACRIGRALNRSRPMTAVRRMALFSVFGLGFVVSIPAGGAPRDKDPREEKLEGTWRQTHAEFDGQDNTEGERPFRNHWMITRDRITIYVKGAHSGAW